MNVNKDLRLICYDCKTVEPLTDANKKKHPLGLEHHSNTVNKDDHQVHVFESMTNKSFNKNRGSI